MAEPLGYRIEDILEGCHFSRRYFQNLRHRGLFPEPTRKVGRVLIWSKDVVEAWVNGTWQPTPKRTARKKAATTK